ncbi:MFS transporter [Persicitalea sp.]|uniref:MFS transporter n=1 Tax=Persicitalea sp. TaxID=3100273 RepID=UPI0035941FDA
MALSPADKSVSILRALSDFFANPLARAVGLVFAADSFLFGSWVARIPYVKYSLDINDAELGLALFLLPIGSIVMNPFTGKIIQRIGSAQSCLIGGLGFFASVMVPILAPNLLILSLGLFIMGFFTALLNVAMNTCAANLEKEQGLTIMSTCHGMWSLGGMLGSALAGALIWADIPASYHLLGVAIFLIIFIILIQPTLRAIHEEKSPESTSLARPTKALMVLIFIGIAVSMGEGVSFDWSAIYLREIANSSASFSALGFAFFSLAMTIGRFVGDTVIPRFGQKRLLAFGGLMAAAGLLIAILFPNPYIVLLGFLVLGFGCSLGAPILYAASMRLPDTTPAAGLATFATLSFIGFMAGPPIVGFIAEGFGLPNGLLFVMILLATSGIASHWARI